MVYIDQTVLKNLAMNVCASVTVAMIALLYPVKSSLKVLRVLQLHKIFAFFVVLQIAFPVTFEYFLTADIRNSITARDLSITERYTIPYYLIEPVVLFSKIKIDTRAVRLKALAKVTYSNITNVLSDFTSDLFTIVQTGYLPRIDAERIALYEEKVRVSFKKNANGEEPDKLDTFVEAYTKVTSSLSAVVIFLDMYLPELMLAIIIDTEDLYNSVLGLFSKDIKTLYIEIKYLFMDTTIDDYHTEADTYAKLYIKKTPFHTENDGKFPLFRESKLFFKISNNVINMFLNGWFITVDLLMIWIKTIVKLLIVYAPPLFFENFFVKLIELFE